jgi:hypothetical protein
MSDKKEENSKKTVFVKLGKETPVPKKPISNQSNLNEKKEKE